MRPTIQDDDASQYQALLARLQRLEQALTPDIETLRAVGDTGEPVFQGTWVNFDAAGDERPASFYRYNGRVYLTGVIKDGTLATTAFVLPAGYLPMPATQPLIYAVTSNNAFGSVFVYPDGTVMPAVGSNAYFSLDGIDFRHA